MPLAFVASTEYCQSVPAFGAWFWPWSEARMPPDDPETTGRGSGATGLGAGLGWGLGLLLPELPEPLEPPEPPPPELPPPEEPPLVVWLGELVVGVLVDEWFEEECFDDVLVPGLGETPPLLVVFVEPPLLDDFLCWFDFLAADVVVVVVVGAVCDVVVEGVVSAAAALDWVVLDFLLLPPQALTPTVSATEHSTPTTSFTPAPPPDRAHGSTIPKQYSSGG